jgi:hypothetical protein
VATVTAVPASATDDAQRGSEQPWSVWDELTPIQTDAVLATAVALLRDPDELAQELLPLLVAVPVTVNFTQPPAVNDDLTVALPLPLRPTPYPRSST